MCLKACSSTWQIGDGCSYHIDIGSRHAINRCISNACVWKLAVAHDRLVMDAITILTLVAGMQLIDALVICVLAIDSFLKAFSSTWQISDRYCYIPDIGAKNRTNRCLCNTCICYSYI